MASMVAKTAPGYVGEVSVLEPSRAAAVGRSGHAAAARPPERGPPRAPRASGWVAVLCLRPLPDAVAVAPRGGAQFHLRIEPGRACPRHEGEQGRADLADAPTAGGLTVGSGIVGAVTAGGLTVGSGIVGAVTAGGLTVGSGIVGAVTAGGADGQVGEFR